MKSKAEEIWERAPVWIKESQIMGERVVDMQALGAEMRAKRMMKGLPPGGVARQMGCEARFLGDLERGSRDWTVGLIDRFLKALERNGI